MAEVKKFIGVATPEKGVTIKLTSRGHVSYADQPKEAGGQDKGPCPIELTMQALSGCIATFIQILAEKQKLSIKNFTVTSECSLNADGNNPEGIFDVKTKVVFDSEESDETLTKLLAIVEKSCPMKNTLEHAIKTDTTWEKGSC